MSLEVAPIGAEFIVNQSMAAFDQMYPVMTPLSDGRVEVLWYDDTLWSQGIVSLNGRFLDSAGNPTGSDFTVDSQAGSGNYYIYNYASAGLPGGSSVVAWAGSGGVVARVLDKNGAVTVPYIQISELNGGVKNAPSVVALAGGGFIATWTDYGTDAAGDVKAWLLDANGLPTTAEFIVSQQTGNAQVTPQVAALPGGGFAITWWDESGVGGDPGDGVKARVFDAAGNPAGDEFLVNTQVYGFQGTPVVATLADGRFVVAWPTIGAYPDFGIAGQIFSSTGQKLGSEFWIDGPSGEARGDSFVRIAALDGGGFAVSWAGSLTNSGQDIVAQAFDSAGNAIGTPFTANATVDGTQFYPAISPLAGNRFVVSWTEPHNQVTGYDVKAHVFTVAESHVGTALADRLISATAQDYIAHGMAGNDTLTGNAGRDALYGEDGNDRLDGRAGADMMVGGAGNDTYFIDNAGDFVVEQAGGGTDLVHSGISYTLSANVEKLTLTGTANLAGTGNELANTLTGNAGNNQLAGGLGKDVLSGGAGNDLLIGGSGADILTGGVGADVFRFDVLEAAANKDTIKDFSHLDDTIEISRAAFAAFAAAPVGALDPLQLALGTAATTASQHLVYNVATGALYYDADGVGGAAHVQIAVLANKAVIDASDIVLI